MTQSDEIHFISKDLYEEIHKGLVGKYFLQCTPFN